MARERRGPVVPKRIKSGADARAVQGVSSRSQKNAENMLRPAITASLIARDYGGIPDDVVELPDLLAALETHIQKISSGDLRLVEAMLAAQAVALDAMFARMARNASANLGHNLEVVQAYLKLALRAQSQSRATLETLAAVKNPGAVNFVRQANIGGAVQVNNGALPSRAGESEFEKNKLLEATHGERLDTGATVTAGRANQGLEAVGEVHRSTKRRGKEEG